MKQGTKRKPSGAASGASHDTLGHAALRALTDSAAEIARQVGVSRQVVHSWLHGQGRPGVATRAALEAAYGIAADMWVMAPAVADVGVPEPVDAPDADPQDDAPLDATLSMLDDQIQRLGRIQAGYGDGLAHPEQVRLSETIGRLLAQRGRLEKDKRVIDAAIERAVINPTRQPFYQRTVNTIVDALKPYPDAMRAVLAALELAQKENAQ